MFTSFQIQDNKYLPSLYSEISTVKSRASVMMYNNEKKTWEPAEGVRGMSNVQVYHHEGNNTFRIVGQSIKDHQVVSTFLYIELSV
jgi:hypothetical protein